MMKSYRRLREVGRVSHAAGGRTILLLVGCLTWAGHSLEAQRGPNEPSAFQPITHQRFEGPLGEGWTQRANPNFSLISDPSAPCSPPGVGRVKFVRGFPGGRGPTNISYEIPPGYRKLYVSFCLRMSRRWVGHPSGVNKILHFWIAGGNRVILSATGAGAGQLIPQFRLQRIRGPRPARNLGVRPGVVLRRDTWHRIELIVASNTPDVANGRIQWWVDGRPAGDAGDLNLVGTAEGTDWRRLSWNPTWGGTNGIIADEQYMDIDDIYVSGGI